MKPRIVQVGLGPLGIKVLQDGVRRGIIDVVGAIDVNPDLDGKPLSELGDGLPSDISVSSGYDGIDWDKAEVAIVTTSSALDRCSDTIEALLERRVHVVSSCEELLFPWLRHEALAEELDLAARRADKVVLGTGVNPGYVMDLLPLVATGVCQDVRSIYVGRIQDATTRRIPFQKKIGATLDRDAFEAKAEEGTLRHVGLGESLHLVAHALGWKLDAWEESLEPVIAERDLECGLGPIPKGVAAGVRQVATGTLGGEEVLRLEFVAAIGQDDPHDQVKIVGTPDVDLVVRGGIHGDVATSALLLHCVYSAREAHSGLRTVADVRPPRWEQ